MLELIDSIKKLNSYKIFKNDFQNGKLSHSYVVNSSDAYSAELFDIACSALILGNEKDRGFVEVNLKHAYPDVEFFPKAGSSIKVEDAANILERLNYFPVKSCAKVYVLGNFESATTQAQNKLLKTLEEPPENVYFFLNTSNIEMILPTVRSRCRTINLEPLPDDIVASAFASKNMSKEQLDMLMFCAGGRLGYAMELSRNPIVFDVFQTALGAILNCTSSLVMLDHASNILKLKNHFGLFLETYAKLFSAGLGYSATKKTSYQYLAQELNTISEQYSVDAIAKILQKTTQLNEMFQRSCNLPLIVDELLLIQLESKQIKK